MCFREKVITVIVVLSVVWNCAGHFNPFSDSELYDLHWSGNIDKNQLKQDQLKQENDNPDQFMIVTTNNKEKYRCHLPIQIHDDKKGVPTLYRGPSEDDLLKPLLLQTSCSYRIESFWSYELCHGKYLRQYHEEKESGKKANIQEYYLGHFKGKSGSPVTEDESRQEEQVGVVKTVKKAKTKKIDGIDLASYQMNMTDGTPCDLTREPRQANILYVCHPQGKGEIYELKEVTSCRYEIVVLTSTLCNHPDYKSKTPSKNDISCFAMDESPSRPKSLDLLELENSQGAYTQNRYKNPFSESPTSSIHINKEGVEDVPEHKVHWDPSAGQHGTEIGSMADKQLLREFLDGTYCLQGGMGWWKHEFCFGRHVKQFHEERNGQRTDIMLGTWDEQKHIEWLLQNPNKKPKPKDQRRHISQFYSNGDFCDLSAKNRQVEVKLKCKENSSQPHSVAIYLIEPKTCEYVIGIESHILCSLMNEVDDAGVIRKALSP